MLDKALSEALEIEVLELRAVRMRERVVNEVSACREEAYQEQNLRLSGWAPELSALIASPTSKAAAEAVVNAIPSIGVQGNYGPPQFGQAGDRGRGCWSCGSMYNIQRSCQQGTPAGRESDCKCESSPPKDQVPVIQISSIQP